MMERPLFAVIAGLAATAFFVPDTPVRQEALAYGMPSAAGATYLVTDTVQMSMQSPMGPMEITMLSQATLTTGFEAAAGAFRATAVVTDFSGSVSSPMMGTQSVGGEAVQGAVVVDVGPNGVTEVVAMPALAPETGFSPFDWLGYDMFPALPGRVVATGDSWTDTFTVSSSGQGSEMTSTIARTLTLGDETVIDGRALRVIDVSATVEIAGSGTQGGMSVNQTFNGTITGQFLWDADVGLLHSAELVRDYEGENTIPGMPPIPMTLKGPQRIVRETG